MVFILVEQVLTSLNYTTQVNEGVKVDFGAGDFGDNSAFVNVAGSDIGFDINEFESLKLTNGNDVVIFEDGVGENLTTRYDTDYFIHDMSMFEIKIRRSFQRWKRLLLYR